MAGEILRPPRLSGDPATDLQGVVEFLWAIYRALAALTPTASANLPYFTAVNAAALTGLSAFMRTMLDDASASVARGTLGLGALAVLDTVGAAVLTDDSVTYAKIQEVPQDRILGRQTASTGNIEEIPCTSAGRALMDDADATAQRATLGLGTIATENAGLSVTITTAKLTALGADGSMTFTAGILTAQTAAT